MKKGAHVIQEIIDQQAEAASFLWVLRDAAVSAPHYTLKALASLDQRIEAHLDGLRVSEEAGWNACLAGLEMEEPGEVFAAAVLAFEAGNGKRIEQVAGYGSSSGENSRALISALGWIELERIRATIDHMMTANAPMYRHLGIAAAAVHRYDPGPTLATASDADDPIVRATALRAAGMLKRRDLLSLLQEHMQSNDTACRFWSSWSALLLGDRSATRPLMAFLNFDTSFRQRAMDILLRVLNADTARNWMKGLLEQIDQRRLVIQGTGATGDPYYVPYLIEQMTIPEFARVAGEAFSMITGVDIAYQDLEGERPEGFEAGPNENPEDERVELDPDEDLPWPEPALIEQWWSANQHRFSLGTRYLCGRPISQESCREVLRHGLQRQRRAAAMEMALMNPDMPLFETRAPGFLQQRLLSAHG